MNTEKMTCDAVLDLTRTNRRQTLITKLWKTPFKAYVPPCIAADCPLAWIS